MLTEYKKSLLWTNSLQLYCMVFVPRPLELNEKVSEKERERFTFLLSAVQNEGSIKAAVKK